MDAMTYLITVGIFYCVLWFFDSFFKSCMHYPYVQFLKSTGLTVKFLRLEWHTTAFNRTLIKWSNKCPRLFAMSFDLGVWFSIIALPVVFVVLVHQLISTRQPEPKEAEMVFEILLPGINLPINELGFYITSLAASSVFHELGHGIASVLEDVPVTGFGFFIFAIIPVAYTEIAQDQLNSLKTFRKLRVFCAGIWHNIILSLTFYIIFLVIPTIFAPLYHVNIGVSVVNIKTDSKLLGERGLHVNDVVTHINSCSVKNADSWYGCLFESLHQQPAYCISNDFVLNHDESTPVFHSNDGLTECCDATNKKNLCFEYISESNVGVLELPQFMCLNVRNVIENSLDYCHKTINCRDNFCIKPILNNATTVVHVKRLTGKDIIYVGHPADLSKTIEVSDFVAKTKMFSTAFVDTIVLFLRYVVVFSSGVAIVNIMPCFAFDGQYIVSAVTHHVLRSVVPNRQRRDLIAFVINFIGSVILVATAMKLIVMVGWKTIF
ncbi:membrane-bound transcription factor site-2 protease [Bradysia coprophila]|uniref:membrane-bound transcription factor site-2 protease n=1 Tax=Bradysia coprophila TaxID=38358 RepID=UPI00187D9071|nr:membrane-bound transcription factor site-2 protease [Bradysia coprophila]